MFIETAGRTLGSGPAQHVLADVRANLRPGWNFPVSP